MPDILTLPLSRIADANGNPYPGALLDVFLTGSTTPATVYQDAALTVAHANPVVADAGGLLPVIFLDPTVIYRFRARTSAGAVISGYDFDPVSTATLRDFVSPQDFDAVGDGVTNDITAITTAAETYPGRLWAGGGLTYKITANLPAGWRMIDGGILDSRTVQAGDAYAVVSIGELSLQANTFIPEQHASSAGPWASGNHIVAIGSQSMQNNTTGRRNTALGSRAMLSNTTGYYNTSVGSHSMENNTTGFENFAGGVQALQTLTTGSGNTAVGVGAGLRITTGVDCVALGRSAGAGAGAVSCTADGMIAIGFQAFAFMQSGFDNIAIGKLAGQIQESGNNNIGVGGSALRNAISSSDNIAIGAAALYTCTASQNISIGSGSSDALTTGTANVAMGHNAFTAATTADNSVIIGHASGLIITTGDQNTVVGKSAGATVTTGSNNTLIGYGADTIAAADNSMALGNGASATKSNQVVLGNTNVTETVLRGYTKQTVYTSGSLPAAATVGPGVRTFVSDSSTTTFAASYTAGGANTVPVYSDGSDWRIG